MSVIRPMMSSLVLALGFLTCTPLAAQDATVEGIVTNLATGQPVAGAAVIMALVESSDAYRFADTDNAGRFSIDGIPPGRYTLSVNHGAFFRPHRDSRPVNLTLVQGQHLRDIHINLAPMAVIAGRIYDENRMPLRSVRVEAFRLEYRDGVRRLVRVGQGNSSQAAMTDDRGDYRLFGLEPGTYYIRATRPSPGTASETAPIYYPGVYDLDNAAPIRLEAGIERNAADISMILTKMYAVRLKILSGPTRPGYVSVSAVRRGRVADTTMRPRVDFLREESLYQISLLPPGSYELLVQVQTGTNTQAGRMSIDIANREEKEIDVGSLTVHPTFAIKGHLVNSTNLVVNRNSVTINLRSLDEDRFSTSSQKPGSSIADDGSFVIAGMSSGRFRIEVTGLPAGLSVTSARYDNKDVLNHDLVVADSEPASLELSLGGADAVGEVKGIVRNLKEMPLPDILVVLVPDRQRRENPNAFRITNTDQMGIFSIQGILPGEYTVLAWEDMESGAYLNPDFLKDFESRGKKIMVDGGSHAAIEVYAIP